MHLELHTSIGPLLHWPMVDDFIQGHHCISRCKNHVQWHLFSFLQPSVWMNMEALTPKQGALGIAPKVPHKVPNICLSAFLKG